MENMVMLLVQLDLQFAYSSVPVPYVCSSIQVLWCLSATLLFPDEQFRQGID